MCKCPKCKYHKKQEVIDNGEFIESYPIDKSQTESNTSIEFHYKYKGKDYYYRKEE